MKQRKEEITKSYDAELGKAQERLKKVKAKREKAKNQGVKERIEEDTRGLVRENKELADQMKTLFKANHVPGFCREIITTHFTLRGHLRIFWHFL